MAGDLYVGLISGTSADGIDAALVSFDEQYPALLQSHLEPFSETTKARLFSLFTPDANQIDLMGQMDVELGALFSQATNNLLQKANIANNQVRAIGSHGQTIRHRPDTENAFTLQIGDPNYIAELTGIDVVADFRRRDMAVGGQGAPLAPAFHGAFLQHQSENRVILNLGGIANITYLPNTGSSNLPMAMDTGPASGLMDAWCQQHLHQHYDDGGQWAEQGNIVAELVLSWRNDPFFNLPAPKSTGKEYFHLDWAKQYATLDNYTAVDVQASLLELSAQTISDAIKALPSVDRVLVCGGGVHNHRLMLRLQQLSSSPVESTASVGIDPDWVEAMAFAWFAKCYCEGVHIDLCHFTGAGKPVRLGGHYSGSNH